MAPGDKCSNCVFFKSHCTNLYISKDSSSSLNYKNCREHVAAILSQTTAYVPSNDPAVLYQTLVDVAKYARNLEELLAVSSTSLDLLSEPSASPDADETTDDLEDASNDGVLVHANITDPLRRLALRVPISRADEHYRFFGKSSTMNFIKEALEYAGGAYTFDAQRPEFWVTHPWQHPTSEIIPSQTFPDDDLLQNLIDIYFQRINPLLFLLHSPTFRASVADREHLCDPHFGAVVLVVCALASRISNDPRVLLTSDATLHTAGWKFFSQIQPLAFELFLQTSNFRWIYRLQLICLSVIFLAGTMHGRSCWTLSGLGLRIAQEMGAHRRSRGRVVEKRSFWAFTALDTVLNSLLGRPTVTTSEDYDVDLPTQCDDDYWTEPYCFQQPAGVPAQTAYMISYLKLMAIYSRMQRALYGVKRQKEREPTIVAELEYATHLFRWDPTLEGVFLEQSASLYVTYYYVQMLIHRPFIPPPGESSPNSTFPSLAICANSARSVGHVLDVHSKRVGDVLHQPHTVTALFDSAVILLLNVWGGRRARLLPSETTRAVTDIKKCVDVLQLYEKRYPMAGRKRDVITEILNRGSGNTPHSANPLLKRPVPEDVDNDSESSNKRFPATSAAQQLEELELSIKETDHLFSLPLYTEELGHLPVGYESFDFQFNFDPHHGPASTSGSDFVFDPPGPAYAADLMQPASGDDSQQFNGAYSWEDWRGHSY
ncbi:hypothetical protein B0H14DRAFT_2781286 [Mycena olivaceomarginata]|nr:hypothetical protein B0H14DRAFT_2781286 [Mycena olivaceomarginata]